MGETGGRMSPYHSLKPVRIVKTLYLTIGLTLLFSFNLFQPLKAQSKEQKGRTTSILSQLHGNRHSFSTESTRFISNKDVQQLINENPGISAATRRQLFAELDLEATGTNWRAVFSEMIMECGSIPTLAISYIDIETGQASAVVTIHLPPDNACSKLTDQLATTIYGGTILEYSEKVVRCDTYQCVRLESTKDVYQCVQTIHLISSEDTCPVPQTCDDFPDCGSRSTKDYTIYVFEELFGAE